MVAAFDAINAAIASLHTLIVACLTMWMQYKVVGREDKPCVGPEHMLYVLDKKDELALDDIACEKCRKNIYKYIRKNTIP